MSPDPAVPEPAAARPAPTVLIVDDEPGFVDTLADILGAKGYNALLASTGREGERIVNQSHVDLAIVDLKLPDVSGVEVLARVRECSPGTEVIILTGHASLDTALRALNLGAYAYLEKPYDVDRLFLIIERALARRARQDSLSRLPELARLLDKSSFPAFAYRTADGRIAFANAAFGRLFGLPDPASTTLSLSDVLSDAGPDAAPQHIARVKTENRATLEFPLRTRPGPPAWYELASSLADGPGDLALGLLADVGARHQAEIESRRARQYFEAIFDDLAAGVAIIDSQFTIQRANPQFARFYHLTPSELVGRKCHETIHNNVTPCQLHGEVCPIVNCLAVGTTARVRHRHRDAEGRLRYQECTMTPLRDESGTVVSFVATFMDFTDIKQAQEESEAKSQELELLNRELTMQGEQLTAQAEELEKTNVELIRLAAAKDDFVSMVSHELRTPLTAISEGINLVADGSLGPANEQQGRFLNLARKNCARLTDLINDILDLSKMEAGRMDVHAARFDITRALAETRDTFAASARERLLSIEAAGLDQPMLVYADERMVRRVLTNLVGNALKFTDQGSIRLAAEHKVDHVLVSVADSGIGIPASEHPKMFERFHQVQQRDRGRPAGTGLGLALTKQMVEMNAGRIWFESEENKGTRFFFTLPLDTDATRAAVLLNSRPGLQADARARRAVLVALANAGQLQERYGTAGLEQVREAVSNLMTGGHANVLGRQALPESHDLLLLLEGTDPELDVQQRALRDRLTGATFVVNEEVVPVRLNMGFCRLNGQTDPKAFLDALRKEAAHVN